MGRGLAIVIVQHPGTSGDVLLTSLIADKTPLTVLEAADGVSVAADHVYVMPADKALSVIDGNLSATDVSQCQGLRMPIDHFLCTLAIDQGRRAVGVILSGTGIDGTHGLAEIRSFGGATAVQEPATADFAEMPQHAVAAGHADVVLPPGKIAAFLVQRADELATETAQQREEAHLEAILTAVRRCTGHDFHCYKRGTLERRIRRRMALHRLVGYDGYARLVRTDKGEATALRKDLLINVTEFFRQPEAWRVLEEKVIAGLVAEAKPQSTLRVWVPACATGKEAYSLAALLAENIERRDKKLGLQMFATDADASAIEMARSGQYSEDDLKGVSQERLARFFTRRDGRYEVVKQLRELIVFSPQDLLSDPPFSRLDFISCRNLFIYLDQSVQKKIIHLFHFALRESGYLFLGSAETVSGEENLFEAVSQKWRIYRKLGVATPVGLHLPLRPASRPPVVIPAPGLQPRPTLPGITHQVIAEWFGPPAAVVDRKGTLLYLHGHVEDFLQMAAGQQTGLLVDVAREGLRNRLAAALLEAVNDNVKVTVSARVKKDQAARRSVPVKITVSPIRHPREVAGLLLVTFEEQKLPKSARAAAAREEPHSDLRQLEDELKITREELSSTIAQLEQSNEHFKAANEEVTSANEELQSTNEELETSKEELQSLNEELNAVNQRLHDKVIELEQASNDVANLLTSGDVATIFLDKELKVRRFTQAITKLLGVVETDAGRPLAHIHRKFKDEALLGDARRVLVDLTPATAEVQAESGEWYLRRILPYRTGDDRIEGVAITFTDVTVLKQAETKLAYLASFPEQNPNPIVEVDFDGGVRYMNAATQRLFPDIRERGAGHPYLADWATTVRPLREGRADTTIRDVAVGERTYEQQCCFVARDRIVRIYGRDVTQRTRAEDALRESAERYRLLAETMLQGVVHQDANGAIIAMNPSAERILGKTREQFLGSSSVREERDTIREDGSIFPGLEHPAMVALRTGQQMRGVVMGVLNPQDAAYRWISVDAVPVFRPGQESPAEVYTVFEDITERRQAEEALRESEQRYRLLFAA